MTKQQKADYLKMNQLCNIINQLDRGKKTKGYYKKREEAMEKLKILFKRVPGVQKGAIQIANRFLDNIKMP